MVCVRYITAFCPGLVTFIECARSLLARTAQHECPAFSNDLGTWCRNYKYVADVHLVWIGLDEKSAVAPTLRLRALLGPGIAAEQLPH